jgi:hypothetical protein
MGGHTSGSREIAELDGKSSERGGDWLIHGSRSAAKIKLKHSKWRQLRPAAMANSGHAQAAIANRELAYAVAQHKSMFFPEKDANKYSIDYKAAVSTDIQIVPDGSALAALEKDYMAMLEDGLLSTHQPSFAEVITQCLELQSTINR